MKHKITKARGELLSPVLFFVYTLCPEHTLLVLPPEGPTPT